MLQTNGLGAHQGIPLCPPMRKEEPGEAWGQPSQVSPQGCAAPAGLPTFISAMALCQVPGTYPTAVTMGCRDIVPQPLSVGT